MCVAANTLESTDDKRCEGSGSPIAAGLRRASVSSLISCKSSCAIELHISPARVEAADTNSRLRALTSLRLLPLAALDQCRLPGESSFFSSCRAVCLFLLHLYSFAPPLKRTPPPQRFVSRLPPAAMPVLPADILSRIFTHTLPRSQQSGAFRKRYKLLNAYSLVCGRWRAVAQALFFQRVHLPTVPTAIKYNNLTKPMGVMYGKETQTLRVGGEWSAGTPSFHRHGAILESLVTHMPFLTEMWLHEVTVDPAVLSWVQGEPLISAFALAALTLPFLPDLKILHLCEVALEYPKQKELFHWRLPHLHTLFMINTLVLAEDRTYLSAEPLFTPLTLPSLTKLFLTWNRDSSPPELELMGPQLTHLYLLRSGFTASTASRDQHIPPDLFAQLSALQHLFYDVRYVTDISLLSSLASPILSLQLYYSSRTAETVEEELVDLLLPDCLYELKMLFLPPPQHEDDVEINALQRLVVPKWREKVEEWIEPAGVREVDSSRYDVETDEAANAWLRRTSDV